MAYHDIDNWAHSANVGFGLALIWMEVFMHEGIV
jgi:hypothetical protein